MAHIHLRRFGGLAPRLNPKVLGQHLAQEATNCRFLSGILGAWRKQKLVESPPVLGTIKTAYYHGREKWIYWSGDVDVVRSPMADNTDERIYFTGTDYPRVTNMTLARSGATPPPALSYALGVPAPVTPTATLGSGGSGTARGLAYILRFVNEWGEEGLASEASNVVTALPGQEVVVTIPSAVYDREWVPIAKVRIYRTLTGTSSVSYRYVDEVAIGTATYTDTKQDTDLAEEAQTDLYPPPVDLKGLVVMPNGFVVGFRENEIVPSEVFQYHGFPVDYRKRLADPIVGIAVVGQTIIVGTTGRPYIISGADPASLSERRLPYRQPCLSKRAMKVTDVGAIYPSPDGLFLVTAGGQGQLVTGGEISKREWESYNPSTMHAEIHDGRYYGFYSTGENSGPYTSSFDSNGALNVDAWNDEAMNDAALIETLIPGASYTTGRGIVYDPSAEVGDRLTELDFYASALFHDLEGDALYMVVSNSDGSAQNLLFDGDDTGLRLSASWKSKLFYSRPLCMNWAQVFADFNYAIEVTTATNVGDLDGATMNEADINGDLLTESTDTTAKGVLFQFYADGALKHEQYVYNNSPFRMPDNYLAQTHEVRVSGTPEVYEIRVAESNEELANLEYAA